MRGSRERIRLASTYALSNSSVRAFSSSMNSTVNRSMDARNRSIALARLMSPAPAASQAKPRRARYAPSATVSSHASRFRASMLPPNSTYASNTVASTSEMASPNACVAIQLNFSRCHAYSVRNRVWLKLHDSTPLDAGRTGSPPPPRSPSFTPGGGCRGETAECVVRSSSNGRRRTVPVGNRRTRSASSGSRRCNLQSRSVAGAQNVPEFSKRAKQACGATRTAFLPPLTRPVQANVRSGQRHRRATFTGPAHRTTAASIQSRPSRYPPAQGRGER